MKSSYSSFWACSVPPTAKKERKKIVGVANIYCGHKKKLQCGVEKTRFNVDFFLQYCQFISGSSIYPRRRYTAGRKKLPLGIEQYLTLCCLPFAKKSVHFWLEYIPSRILVFPWQPKKATSIVLTSRLGEESLRRRVYDLKFPPSKLATRWTAAFHRISLYKRGHL